MQLDPGLTNFICFSLERKKNVLIPYNEVILLYLTLYRKRMTYFELDTVIWYYSTSVIYTPLECSHLEYAL